MTHLERGAMVASSPETLISAAQKCLCSRKKRLSPSSCLEVTIHIIAVDLGVKPALLYDSNGASPDQLQLYLHSLQESGVVSNSLRIMSINDNTFIINPDIMKSHLGELLKSKSLPLIDVCSSRKRPVLCAFERSAEEMVRSFLEVFMNGLDLVVLEEELYKDWNLCTFFGILLGYPASYWFEQTQGFENCLSMTPLVVCTVWVRWQIHEIKQRCCLYSFSVPEELWSDVQSHIQCWTDHLRERFSKQTVLTDLCFSRDTVTLPSVTL